MFYSFWLSQEKLETCCFRLSRGLSASLSQGSLLQMSIVKLPGQCLCQCGSYQRSEFSTLLFVKSKFSFKSIFKHKPSHITFSLLLSILRSSLPCLLLPPSFCSTFSSGFMLLFALISHPFHPSVAGNVRASAVMRAEL